jgi:hypothetical protein
MQYSTRDMNDVARELATRGERGTASLFKNLVLQAATNRQSIVITDNPAVISIMDNYLGRLNRTNMSFKVARKYPSRKPNKRYSPELLKSH